MRSTAISMWTRSEKPGAAAPTVKRPWTGRALRYMAFAPFRWGWWMASRVEQSTGIVFTLIVGVIMVLGGFWLSSTVLGMLLGVPMMVVGAFLALRAMY